MAIKKALVIYSGSIEELRDGDSLGASGDVTGPSSSTDNAIARFDGTTGKLLQNSTITLDDTGNLGGVNSVNLDTTPTTPPTAVGTMFWDDGNKTPSINLENDVVLQLGQEIVTLCYNGTGSTITNGSVIAVTGAQGQRPSIVLADADSESTSARTLGIATQDIANGTEGFITSFGFVRGINTASITAGNAVYLSQTAGQFTATKPNAPAHLVHLGYVIKSHASAGEIFVTINNGWEFDELHDVLITDVQSGQIPLRDQTLGVWKNITINGTTNEVTVTSTKDGITISLPDTISASITGNAGTVTNGVYTTDIGVSVQAYDADLSAIAGLAGTSGFLKKTAANTWSLDTNTYLTGITSTMVTDALGYTPYSNTNPAGYTTNTGTVTNVGGGDGLTGSVTTSGDLALGTPSTLTTSTTNAVTADSHTHAVTFPVTSVNGQTGDITITAGGGFSNLVVITSTQNWTVPTNVTKCKVTIWGGGGGGGGANGATSGNNNNSAGGGGSGGYACELVTGLTPGSTVTVTVGNGGGGGTGPSGVGSTGGTTSFGAYCSATGGTGGAGAGTGTATTTPTPGQGGTGSGGNVNLTGFYGKAMIGMNAYIGSTTQNSSTAAVFGADAIAGVGRGGLISNSSWTGGNATGYSAGGGGATGRSSFNTNYTGGTGGAGLVIIEY